MLNKIIKKDSTGKLRIWQVSVVQDEIIQEAGLVDGKLVVNSKKCTSKNIGKINMTDPGEQAILEAKALVIVPPNATAALA